MASDTPVRLMPSRRPDPDIDRRERSWTLIAGSHRVSFTRIDHRVASRPHPAVVQSAPRWSLMGTAAVVLGAVVAMATLGLAMNASRAATGDRYVLSIAVPMVSPFKAVGHHAKPISMAHRPTAAIDRVDPTTVAAVAAPPVDESLPLSDTVMPAAAMTMQPAIAAALRTGTLQQWASPDDAEHGFVVAGPAEQGCRTLSILTRRDGGNEVRARRECMAGTDGQAGTPATP